jgi:uncharacterized protein (TIGR03000 family)
MKRPSWKSILFLLVIVAALVAATDQANAWWGCCRPAYYGCYGCYTPCYSSCYSPCWDSCCGGYYLGWRPGPVRRLLLGRYRWYYGGCCYSSCYSGCYSGCSTCGSYDVGCCGATTVDTTTAPAVNQQPTPAQMPKPVMEGPKAPTPALEMPKEPGPGPAAPTLGPSSGLPNPEPPAIPPLPGEPKTSAVPTPENSGVITVWVPFDAKVTVNGLTTKSTGSRRQFVSYGLKPGYSYKYEVHAEVVRNGQIVEENRSVVLTMGQDTAVVFGFNTQSVENLASTK